MKDKNLRKQMFGYWYTQDREVGGPELVIDHKWHIQMADGVVRHLLKEIDELNNKVRLLNDKLESKKK